MAFFRPENPLAPGAVYARSNGKITVTLHKSRDDELNAKLRELAKMRDARMAAADTTRDAEHREAVAAYHADEAALLAEFAARPLPVVVGVQLAWDAVEAGKTVSGIGKADDLSATSSAVNGEPLLLDTGKGAA